MKEDIPVIILTTVNKMNIGELEGLRDIILPRKPFAWQFQIVSSYGRMKERQEWLLDENEYLFLVEFLARLKRQTSTTRIDPADCIGYYTELEEDLRGENEQWHGCHAGIRALGIQSNGNVKGCLSLLDDDFFVEGNVRQETILDIWDKPGAFSYNREFTPDKLEGTCKGCPEGIRCRAGCTSTAHSITGSCWNAPYCVYQTKVLNTDREIRLAAAS
jgi:radical SAM protein with 4Fe4S-binding SPASM domain